MRRPSPGWRPFHSRIWLQDSRSTQRPMSRIRPISSASGMKAAGPQRAAFGMLPAHEGLHAFDALGHEVVDGLIQQAELVARNRMAQVRLQGQRLYGLGVHGSRENGVADRAAPLGLVHGDIGIAQQLFRPADIRRRGDADAGGGEHVLAADPQR